MKANGPVDFVVVVVVVVSFILFTVVEFFVDVSVDVVSFSFILFDALCRIVVFDTLCRLVLFDAFGRLVAFEAF